MEMVFYCHDYSKNKKVKLVVIEFLDYVIVWWDQLVLNKRRIGSQRWKHGKR